MHQSTLLLLPTASLALWLLYRSIKQKPSFTTAKKETPISDQIHQDITELIGNTPIIRIKSLSSLLSCNILAKVEYLNPGGSAKDRVALQIIQDAEDQLKLTPGSDICIFEGTSGSTGISMCMVAHAKGYHSYIVMPNDVASEKRLLLERMGATVELVKPCSIVDPGNFVRVAERRAKEYTEGSLEISSQPKTSSKKPRCGYFMNQFENPSNLKAHYNHTGPEIYAQTGGKLDAIVHGSATGGTLAGMTLYLKPKIPNLKVYLADPPGSGLANKVNYNVMYSESEKEGKRRRHQIDTIVEGVGLNRLTKNFSLLFDRNEVKKLRKGDSEVSLSTRMLTTALNGAFVIPDQKTIWMSRWLMKHDGLFVGSSSALNCVAVIEIARILGPGCTILTILCDSGQRHLTKFWNNEWLQKNGFDSDTPEDLSVF
ncbi:hypothetical protein BB559_000143 [Furculomyces boomerangus]|uniref:Tryptophan synthase beta chain-like PALP domain-containing protein n=2 Tax=Harpellales TaxID=61421 RepID=A0A2T9Z668_9FUNG|nr:hypothetical protein BB559_000143 [Furculomyces boomerangus]PVZ99684.1 hypothetical protein BB558_004281 [Smittium angustum]PWA03360.1 hypothetical protein BB558_000486 [Smittium angustum]